MKEYFIVAIEGIEYQFEGFAKAFKKYQELKALGYHEALLRKYCLEYGHPLVYIYNDRAKCFFA